MIKAIRPNALQIRTPMSQDTAFLFSAKLLFASKRLRRRFAISNHFLEILVGNESISHQLLECRASSHRFYTHAALLFPKPIAETADGFNCVAGFAEFFAQAAHVRVN